MHDGRDQSWARAGHSCHLLRRKGWPQALINFVPVCAARGDSALVVSEQPKLAPDRMEALQSRLQLAPQQSDPLLTKPLLLRLEALILHGSIFERWS